MKAPKLDFYVDTIANPDAAKVIRLDAAREARKAVLRHQLACAVQKADEAARKALAERVAQARRAMLKIV